MERIFCIAIESCVKNFRTVTGDLILYFKFRCLVSHEAPYTGGFGAEIAAAVQVPVFAFSRKVLVT